MGLTKAEQDALSVADDITPLQAKAKEDGDSTLYLQLRSLQMKEEVCGDTHVSLLPTLARLSGEMLTVLLGVCAHPVATRSVDGQGAH